MNIETLRRIAQWLDSKYTLPGGFRIGWDGLLGLIPGLGSLITTVIAACSLLVAAQLKTPWIVIFRMAVNIVIDNLLGAIPGIGWIADFLYKSNLKNIELLDTYLAQPQPVVRQSWLAFGVILFVLFFMSASLILLGVALVQAIGGWILQAL